MAYINCTAAQAVARFKADEARFGGQQWCWNYPGNFTYWGTRNYYWCALQIVRNLLGGRDMRKVIKNWGSVPAWYDFMATTPASNFLTVPWTAGAAGDIIIYSAGTYRGHIEMLTAATRGDTLYVGGGDTSSPKFPGSDTMGGVIVSKTRSGSMQNQGRLSTRVWRPSYLEPPKPKPTPANAKLTEDGIFGPKSVSALEAYLRSSVVDGVVSAQPSVNRVLLPNLTAVQWVAPSKATGSTVVRLLQRRVGSGADGLWGPNTTEDVQRRVGVTQDRIFGPASARALQHSINVGTL